PNPVKTGTTIRIVLNNGIKEMMQIEWYDVSGRLLKEEKVFNNDQPLFLIVPEKVQEGIYLLKITTSNQVHTEKLVVSQ
ncbi:MAG: T9SS type A sorting domain-containing protein, partial [Chitinophagales bacterium]